MLALMGMYRIVAAFDASRTDHEAVLAEARRARDSVEALELGKDGHVLEAVLDVYGGALAAAAVSGGDGALVGVDHGYGRARLIAPPEVVAIAEALAAIGPAPLPRPDPDGYVADARLATDPRLLEVARRLLRHGLDPGSYDAMSELQSAMDDLIAHYASAAKQGRAILTFLT
ncbi:MAG: hypothetical protein H6719_17625 [Sandaracinaceae bacterium]|nr:hypothetical protein [Sandaracinaceae bacterium]